MNIGIETKCSVLVSSFDGYSDLWRPYFNLLFRFWPDRKLPLYLITEEKDAELEDVHSLCLGRTKDWSTLTLKALSRIETPYVLFTLEDFFLRDRVDNQLIERLVERMDHDGLNMLRLLPRPGPNEKINDKEYGLIKKGSAYRVSTQVAIWKKSVLEELLKSGESAWEFEHRGTFRSDSLDGFACMYASVFPYGHHVIERGKWFPWDYKKFSEMGIGIVAGSRQVMNLRESMRWGLFKGLGMVSSSLPKSVSESIKRMIR